jgi:hypothetical protein
VPRPADGERTRISLSSSGFSAGKKELAVLGFVAAVLFAIAFVIYATFMSTIAVLSPTSLLLAGLALRRSARRVHRHGLSVPRRRSRR